MPACCTWYAELAHSAHSLMSSHTSLAQDLSLVRNISRVIHERTSLSRFSSSTSTCPSLSSSFPSTSCTSSSTLSSTTWSSWKACATPPTRGVTTPTTSPPPSQVMSPTSWLSASSTTHRVPSPTLSRHRTRTWMTWHSASCSQRHTEDKPITANQKACQSVSRRRLLCSMDQGNLMEKEMSINQLVLVPQGTRTVLTASSLETPKLRKWSMDQGNLMSEIARAHRLGLYLKNRDRWLSRNIAKKSVITNSKQLMQKKNADFHAKNYGDKNGISRSSSTKSYTDGGITKIPEFYLRYYGETKAHRGPEHYFGIIRQSTGTAKSIKLYERFQGFPGCWISSQWKVPRYQSTSVIPTSSDTWRIVEAFFRIAAPQRRAAKHLGHTWYIGKRFCKSTYIFISSLSSRIESMEFVNLGAAPYIYSGENWKTRTKSRSEMPVWTVSQRFSHLQWRRLFKELWGRPTKTADFGSPLWQVPHTSNLCLLEDKVQDRGMYLFTIVLRKQCSGSKKWSWLIQWTIWESSSSTTWYFNAEFWSTWCEDCFSIEQNQSIIPISEGRISLEEQKAQKAGPFPSRKTDCLLDLRLQFRVTGNRWFCRKLHRPVHHQFFEMTRFGNSILSGTEFYSPWRKSRLMTSWKDCTKKEFESLISSRPYWNCTTWRLIRRS